MATVFERCKGYLNRYGEYVMRGRKEAALMALIWTFIPLMGWVGTVIMALVTLRNGAFEGFLVLLWITLPSVVYAFLGYSAPLIFGILCGSLVTWILALMLREYRSWVVVLQVGVLLGMVVVLAIHGFKPDINQYWYKLFEKYYSDAESALALRVSAADLQNVIVLMSKIATGVQAVVFLAMAIFNLLIARWWQASLYNPGGLAQEFYKIRLNYMADAVLMLILAAILLGLTWAWDLLPLALVIFLIAGISLIHGLAQMTKVMWVILLGYYGLLILFFPYIGVLTIVIAFFDTFVDFRQKVKNQMA